MELSNIIPLLVILLSGSSAAECESGWTPVNDELCIKIFTDLLTYEEASDFCSSQGSAASSLVMVKALDIQEFLATYTQDTYDYLWLGGTYDAGSGEYRWEDGEALTYTNWQEGYPRNSTDSACIELRPVNAKAASMADGKWADVNCQKRNLVMCQRVRSWSLEDAVVEIIRLRKELADTENALRGELADATAERNGLRQDLTTALAELSEATIERNDLRRDLSTTQLDLVALSSTVVPVGSIYIEYYNQPSPQSLWPSMNWQDISSTYAGLFFRASGGNSSNWGFTQGYCAPRITQMSGTSLSAPLPRSVDIPSSGWSPFVMAGFNTDNVDNDGVRLYTDDCEVRPQNQAVRIWKRMS